MITAFTYLKGLKTVTRGSKETYPPPKSRLSQATHKANFPLLVLFTFVSGVASKPDFVPVAKGRGGVFPTGPSSMALWMTPPR